MSSQTTYTCDHCGKIIEDPINGLFRIHIKPASGLYTYQPDLCGPCWFALLKFIGCGNHDG